MDPAFLRRFDMVFDLPIAPQSQREKMIKKSSCGTLDSRTISHLAKSEELSPAIISRAVSIACMVTPNLKNTSSGETITFLVNKTLEPQGYASIRRNDPNRLPELYDPAVVNADANLLEITQSQSARLCLYGPPGTGKTAFGHWLAKQVGVPLHIKRISDLSSMWVGKTEKNIANAFRNSVREKAILMIDEVESFLQDRRSAHQSWEVSQVNEMLTQMESFPGIFIASTNLMDGLDQASLRRFDMKIKFNFLKTEQAWHLFCRYCHTMGFPAPDNTSQKCLARWHNLTPGDFSAVARQARFRKIVSVKELISALEMEASMKENSKQTIGSV
ncbi:MAG: ATP-binding protein [Alistipes senegalensis]|nr:ATP-binding protein [Oxalobacter formigenes]MCM1281924.1 ATP-binding protein [Alistipes senegalensis]